MTDRINPFEVAQAAIALLTRISEGKRGMDGWVPVEEDIVPVAERIASLLNAADDSSMPVKLRAAFKSAFQVLNAEVRGQRGGPHLTSEDIDPIIEQLNDALTNTETS